MTPDEFLERDVPVVGPGVATEVGVLAANEAATVGKEFEEVSREFKDLSVVENAVEENVESLLEVSTNVVKVMSNGETVMPQTAGYIVESSSMDYELLSVGAPVEKIETAPLVSVTVVSNESIMDAENIAKFNELLSVVLPEEIEDTNPVAAGVSNSSKEIENTSMFCDQSSETPEGTKGTAQLVSKKDTSLFLPRLGFPVALASPTSNSNEHVKENAPSAENSCNSSAEIPSVSKVMQALPAGTVSPATESEVSEIPSDSKEIQALPTGKVSPATENQVSEIPSGSKKMQALPTGEVSPAMEDEVSEIPSDSKEMQAVPTTVSPATENQVYFACPMHCNPECCFAKWPRCQSDVENMMSSVVDLKSAIHSLKEDLQKALDKLDAISY